MDNELNITISNIDFDRFNNDFDADFDVNFNFGNLQKLNIANTNLTYIDKAEHIVPDKKFGDAFYISYHGINPLVILKEDVKVLEAIILSDPNRIMLSILLQNIDGNKSVRKDTSVPIIAGFIDAMYERLENTKWLESEFKLADKICTDFSTNWSILKKTILDILASKANQVELSPIISNMIENAHISGNKNVLDICRLPGCNSLYTATSKMFKDLMYNPNLELIMYLRQSIAFYQKYDKHSNSETKKIYSEYNTRNYNYDTLDVPSRSEIGVLSKLGFPVAIAGFENYIKPQINVPTKNGAIGKYNDAFLKNVLFVPFIMTLDLLNERKTNEDIILNY